MNIDYNAVIETLKNFINNEKTEILGISVGEERQVKDAIKNLLTAYEKEKDLNNELQIRYKIEHDKYREERDENKKLQGIIDLMADDLVDDEKYIEDLADFEYFPEYKTKEEAIKYFEERCKNE